MGLATGKLVHEVSLGETQVQNVEFIDNDRHLVVTPQEGPVLILTMDLNELLQVGRTRLTRGFDRSRVREISPGSLPGLGRSCGFLAERNWCPRPGLWEPGPRGQGSHCGVIPGAVYPPLISAMYSGTRRSQIAKNAGENLFPSSSVDVMFPNSSG